ncbi:MAG: hypothetical protein ACOYOP_02580 [Microthrixaceae bacterium]
MAGSVRDATDRARPRADDVVTVEFLDRTVVVPEGESLEFGRAAELVIDTNPLLHRRLGRLVYRGGTWWLENIGSSIALRLADSESGAFALVPAGTRAAVTAHRSRVTFSAGAARYSMAVVLAAPDGPVGDASAGPSSVPDGTTTRTSDLPLNTDQRMLLAALCESRLRDPAAPLALPSNTEVARRLGWSRPKLNRKIDWLCERYHRAGVAGLKVDGGRATGRRRRLAEHALDHGLVGPEDLALLD